MKDLVRKTKKAEQKAVHIHGPDKGDHYAQSRQIRELTCLYEVTRALSGSPNLRDALTEVTEKLASRMGMTMGTITIVNPRDSSIQIEVAHGLSDEAKRRGRYKLGEGITGRVVDTGEPLVVPKVGEDPRFLNRTRSRKGTDREDVSFLCVPINDGPTTIGALSVDRPFHSDVSLEEDIQFLTIISGLVARTVGRLREAQAEKESLLRENQLLRRALSEKYEMGNLIGKSSRMQEVFDMVHRVAGSNATVLLRGESGTGKSMVARAIHFNSPRKDGPFVTVNCSALPETLIERELFGHEKGAFTGADSVGKGRFELAQAGTIFLDEIGELPASVQVKLLGVIQDREFQRLGGTKTISCDVRIVAATNKNLEEAMQKGQFREDLYYRLNVFPIFLPSLRERRSDILLFAEHFLARYSSENNKNIERISTPAIDLLMQYHWPGNVRELQNCIERAVLVCDEDVIRTYHLPPTLQTASSLGHKPGEKRSLPNAVANFERELIIEALKEKRGNQTKAAELLGTSLRIINYKIHKYGINPSSYKIFRSR